MIPRAAIQAWAAEHPWPTLVTVEQDLVLARLIVAFAKHPLLAEELVFRGGTCLHQLVMDRPRRYSEDLDFVRTTHSPLRPILDGVREVAGTAHRSRAVHRLECMVQRFGRRQDVRGTRTDRHQDPSAPSTAKGP